MRVNAVLTDDGEQRTDLDIHADTCVIGQHALIVYDFNRPVNVTGYDPLKGTMAPNRPTVSAAIAYDCPMTGEVFIIEIHQAILIDELVKQVSALVAVMTTDSAPKAPGTAPPTTNANNPALTRQGILRG